MKESVSAASDRMAAEYPLCYGIVCGGEMAETGLVALEARIDIGNFPQGFELEPDASLSSIVGLAAG